MSQAREIRLRYEWHEGSLPPPYHYEYRIEVRGDEGLIDFSPDYPGEGTPRWVEAFTVDAARVARIVRRVESEGLLRSTWEEEPGNAPVGGSHDWLEIEVDGARFTIPSWVSRADDKAKEVVAEVRSLVPEPLWDELMRRRQDYEDAGV